jgi:hypothetical protein
MRRFEPRPIAFLGVLEHGDWRVKLYSIALDAPLVDEARFAPVVDMALSALPQPAQADGRAGVGFFIFHQGRGADYAVLGWWDRENELPVRVFIRTDEHPDWRPARDGESFCVWDLQLIAFERDAYVDTVLADPPMGADAYLARVLNVPLPVPS